MDGSDGVVIQDGYYVFPEGMIVVPVDGTDSRYVFWQSECRCGLKQCCERKYDSQRVRDTVQVRAGDCS